MRSSDNWQWLLTGALLSLLAASARAESTETASLIYEAGGYHCEAGEQGTDSSGRPYTQVPSCTLLEGGSVIRPEVGKVLGCRLKFPGESTETIVRFQTHWRVPAPGLPDPVTGELRREWGMARRVHVGEELLVGYSLDLEEELVEGNWRLDILVDGNIAASCCFDVTSDPSAVSESSLAACPDVDP